MSPQRDELWCLLSESGQRGQTHVHLSDVQPWGTGFSTSRIEWTKATQLPLHFELSHSRPISAIKTLAEAVKDVFLHPTTDGQGLNIEIGLPAYPGRENQSENTAYVSLSSIDLNKFFSP